MKYTLLLFFLFTTQSFADEKCEAFLGVKINGFVGDTVQEIAKAQDCNENLKSLKFNYIEGQSKSDFCACTKADPKTLAGNSQKSIRAERRYQEIKKKTQNEAEVKFAKTLRNKIFGTLSRSFKFDNLAKRGYIGNELAIDKKLNLCSVDKILDNIGNFGLFAENNTSCKGKDKLFEERKKLLFPEGEEAFIQNLKDVANTVAKGVRGEGSCLTYQNYLELNSTVPENSEAIKLMMKSTSWEDFKASVAEELRYYDNFKSLQNQMRQSVSERSNEVANNLWGFSGKQIRGKDVYRMIKSNPNFELALRDKSIFEQMKNSMNLFENEYNGSNGGFIDYKKTRQFSDINEFLNKNSDVALKAHLKSCDNSEQAPIRSGGRGGGQTTTSLGLKQSIAKFLCDENLPTERVDGINNSLDHVVGYEDKDNKILRESIRSDLICSSNANITQEYFFDIDPSLNIDPDLDLKDKGTFLADYKDFSKSFCKMISPDCSDPKKAKLNAKCSKLTTMAQTALANELVKFTESKALQDANANTGVFLMAMAMGAPHESSEEAYLKIKNYLEKNHADKLKPSDYLELREKILLLRPHTERVALYVEMSKLGNLPKMDLPPSKYFKSPEGIEFLKKHESPSARVMLGILADDTSVNFQNDLTVSKFADVYINGHSQNSDTSPIFAKSGPKIDSEYYGVVTPKDQTPNRTPATVSQNDDGVIKRIWGARKGDGSKGLKDNWGAVKDAVKKPEQVKQEVVAISTEPVDSTKAIRSLDDLANVSAEVVDTGVRDQKGIPKIEAPKPGSATIAGSSSPEEAKREKINLEKFTNLQNNGGSLQTLSFSSSTLGGSDNDSGAESNSRSILNSENDFLNNLKKQKMLDEISRIKEQLKESDSGRTAVEDISPERLAEHEKLKERINSLESEFEKTERSMRSGLSSNQMTRRSNYLNDSGYDIQSDTDPNFWNNVRNKRDDFNPRDPFKRAETKREVSPEHMDELDPSGASVAKKTGVKAGGVKGRVGVGLNADSGNSDGLFSDLGLKPIRKRGPASSESELDPEELCGFEEQELNCIFEHSEIFVRFQKNQIRSLVEGLLLQGYTFKTIEVIRNRDPKIPHNYFVHFFEPDKNLSMEDKKTQFELIKKLFLDYKKNYSILKGIAKKVVRTKTVEISKKEAFVILKHTLKRDDINRLLVRRLKSVERLQANK